MAIATHIKLASYSKGPQRLYVEELLFIVLEFLSVFVIKL